MNKRRARKWFGVMLILASVLGATGVGAAVNEPIEVSDIVGIPCNANVSACGFDLGPQSDYVVLLDISDCGYTQPLEMTLYGVIATSVEQFTENGVSGTKSTVMFSGQGLLVTNDWVELSFTNVKVITPQVTTYSSVVDAVGPGFEIHRDRDVNELAPGGRMYTITDSPDCTRRFSN